MLPSQNILKEIKKFHSEYITLQLNKCDLEKIPDLIFRILFPICKEMKSGDEEIILNRIQRILLKNITHLNIEDLEYKVNSFFLQLPKIQNKLYEDAKSFYRNDPASYSVEEVILSYPGFYAIVVYRLANALYSLDIPIIPRLWAEYAHSKGGIDINPGATIGERFFLDHGTGVVIGETCIIGDDVKIYQNVTLGALYITKNMQNKKRHPTVQNNVVIYSGATILGGQTVIGANSTIGGNVWLTESVPPSSTVYYKSKVNHK